MPPQVRTNDNETERSGTKNLLISALISAAVSYPLGILASWQANQIPREFSFRFLFEALRSLWFWLWFGPFFFLLLLLVANVRKRRSMEMMSCQVEGRCREGWTGIDRITGLQKYYVKLDGSPYHPVNCLNDIKHHLDFMGHGARKWTSLKDQLEDMLQTVKIRNGNVRFLIFNPCHEQDRKEASEIAESLKILNTLRQDCKNLEIRVYDHLPQFRLMFIDDRTLVLGHYKGRKRGDSKDTPLYVYSEDPDWSFYYAFKSHFEAEWKEANEPDWDKIRSLST